MARDEGCHVERGAHAGASAGDRGAAAVNPALLDVGRESGKARCDAPPDVAELGHICCEPGGPTLGAFCSKVRVSPRPASRSSAFSRSSISSR